MNEDLDKLVESGDIISYEIDNRDHTTETLRILLLSGKVLSVGSVNFGDSSCLVVGSW